MKIHVNTYYPSSSINTNTGSTTITDIPSGESFEDVLVLNQNALRAMTIDAMIAESNTGAIDPDAVDAAAIMNFRSTLTGNIVAPIPDTNFTLGAPQGTPSNLVSTTAPASPSTPESLTETLTEALGGIFNTGSLKCSDELNRYFQEAANKYGVDSKLLKSIACAESNFNPDCTSSAGAMGIMQMMPETAKSCGISDPYDARQSIMGGANYISQMLQRYDGNITLALAAYNAGPGNVNKYGGVPPFKETQNYVTKVLEYYNS